jgi:hypothetical protein
MKEASFILLLALLGAGGSRAAEPGGGEIVRVTESGPVRAEVRVSPEKPALGDPLRLVLRVRAERDVELRLPAFGEALGRFAISSFAPRKAPGPDGSTEESQEYVLETPGSGKQKIPPLLVEFVDRRGGASGTSTGPRELLTEEIGIEVASVLGGEEKAAELRGPLGPLPEGGEGGPRARWPWAAGGLGALGLAVAVAVWGRRRREEEEVRDPLAAALARLAALEGRGLPASDAADGWYVEISAIVRRYLEDRFALRAPELTTEEFLLRAGDGTLLAPGHRALLRGFLERCDRVKFAAYRPPESESGEVIAAARRFLEESTPQSPKATDAAPV